jgi:hypothetical protein
VAEWQLRDYRVDPAHFTDFLAAWSAGVLPLRRAAGFTVEAWAIEAEARFVWLIGYDGPDSFEDADAAYYASPARVALEPDPAQWVLEGHHAAVKPVTREQADPG